MRPLCNWTMRQELYSPTPVPRRFLSAGSSRRENRRKSLFCCAALKPGPEFQPLLDEAARLQRRGKLRDRKAALAWLKTR